MLLFLLFAFAAADCSTGTCNVCKNMTGCDWYKFDCYNTSSSAVTSLKIPASATCDPCQAGSCSDCEAQIGCSWFKSNVGLSGKCAATNSSQTLYTQLDQCPVCNTYSTCDACSSANETCGWYELAGSSGRCREAAPSFAWTKVKLGFCGGDPCQGQTACTKCQAVSVNNMTSLCSWFNSDNPSFYSSKCGDSAGGTFNNAFYTEANTCPPCAGTNCLDCKAEANCKWVAVSLGALGTSFGQCIQSSAAMPTGKSEITTCPATCNVHSCDQCKAQSACTWYTGGFGVDDSCDLSSDASVHFTQKAADTCPMCAADRCYECNGLSGCGWYANTVAGVIVREGCFPTASAPSGRTLIENSNKKCKGVPSSSAHVAVSMVVMVVLALVA